MSEIKKLANQTMWYGMSSIIARFLNYLLVPFYTVYLAHSPALYGIQTEFYAYVSFFIVILTFGFETGYFRFVSKTENKNLVYSTAQIFIIIISLIFIILLFTFSGKIAAFLQYKNNPEFIRLFAIILAIDAITSIAFAKLRFYEKAFKFAVIKLINVLINLAANIWFFIICPLIFKSNPTSIFLIGYDPSINVTYVFISNLIASCSTLLLLLPQYFILNKFDVQLFKKMFVYSLPIMITGLGGIINETLDRILLKHFLINSSNAMFQLGIYGANLKLGIIIVLFTQMFRYAFEPFFFKQAGNVKSKQMFADIMLYFAIFNLLVFLIINLYIDIFKHFIGVEYYEGLKIVPIVMIAYIFLGMLVNLSVWYKLEDLTQYGIYITFIGVAITFIFSFLLVPKYGYTGAAWTKLICYFTMCLVSYLWGNKFYPIPYDIKKLLMYFTIALVLYFISVNLLNCSVVIRYIVNFIFLSFFIIYIEMHEHLIKRIIHK